MKKLLIFAAALAAVSTAGACSESTRSDNDSVAAFETGGEPAPATASPGDAGIAEYAGVPQAETLLTLDDSVIGLCVPMDVDDSYVLSAGSGSLDSGALDILGSCLSRAVDEGYAFELVGETGPAYPWDFVEGVHHSDRVRHWLSELGVPPESMVLSRAEEPLQGELVDGQVHLRVAT